MASVSVRPDPADNLCGGYWIRRHVAPEPIHLDSRVDPTFLVRPLPQRLVDRTAALSRRNALKKVPCIVLYDDIDSMAHDWQP